MADASSQLGVFLLSALLVSGAASEAARSGISIQPAPLPLRPPFKFTLWLYLTTNAHEHSNGSS
jgi:hypothetical protein